VFSDLTATDKKTGLMWTRDANIAKKDMTWKNAFKFIEELNKQKYAGHSDWRLPTKEEFISLLQYANDKYYRRKSAKMSLYKFFNEIGFRNVQADVYWSSTTSAGATAGAWSVSMWYGNVDGYVKTGTYYVWPVRAGR
jgi:hypothetical protein